MHQHTRLTNKICMEPLNLKVIDCYRAFQQFMLHLLNDNILAVEKLQPVSCLELYRVCPTLNRRVKRVIRSTGNPLTVYYHMFIGHPNETSRFDVLNRHKPRLYFRSRAPQINGTLFKSILLTIR